MKDNRNIRKILYLSKSNIALIVLNELESGQNILFANQVNVDANNLQFKVLELLTNAANFLGFNIKSVEIIFDDPIMTNITMNKQEFIDCISEQDISKEIYKKAKIDNYYVNEINFYGVVYDDIERVARANYQICASDYITYKKYIKAVKDCNVAVTNTTNLYKLLKGNKADVELSIKIDNTQAIACEYYGKNLNNVKVIDLQLNEIKTHLANKFDIASNKIDQMLALANKLCLDNEDICLSNNYDLKTKQFNKVTLKEFINSYRAEVKNQISAYVDYRNFNNIQIISNNEINALEGFEFVRNDDICLENISLDKIVCLNNLFSNKDENSQFRFENRIKSINLAA